MNTRFYNLGRYFLRPFYNLFWPSKVTGEENIPDEGGFILCSNHVHMRDPLFLAEDFIPVIQKSGHTEVDQLTDAVSCINIINRNIWQFL